MHQEDAEQQSSPKEKKDEQANANESVTKEVPIKTVPGKKESDAKNVSKSEGKSTGGCNDASQNSSPVCDNAAFPCLDASVAGGNGSAAFPSLAVSMGGGKKSGKRSGKA